MPKYIVYGVVSGSKCLGEFEADTKEGAMNEAAESDECYVSLCHQCSGEVDGAEIHEFVVNEVEVAT